MGRLFSDVRLWLVIALPVLLAGVFMLPLWLPEILQLIGTTQPSFAGVLDWVKATPHAAPLGYFTQFSVMAILGHSILAIRATSLAFALGSCYLLWRLATRIGVQQPILALVLFLLLPIHYRFEVEATVFEQALFFSLLAALCFRALLVNPTIANACLYSLALTLCLYTEPLSFLPAVGYMVFLLPFIAGKERRRALWHILPATALPVLLYAPFFIWARQFEMPNWLLGHDTYSLAQASWPAVFRDLTGGGDVGFVLTTVLLVGALIATWRAFRYTEAAQAKRIILFCFLGGAVTTVAIVLAIDNASALSFSPSQFLWAVPELIILLTIALDWVEANSKYVAYALATGVVGLSLAGDYILVTKRSEDIGALTVRVAQELQGDSCVVFLSEGVLTHRIFAVFDPGLLSHECANFFHARILLLSHPDVRLDQQRDGETFFHGLDFIEKKRIKAGEGLLVVLEQNSK
jgi:hypothetical protein